MEKPISVRFEMNQESINSDDEGVAKTEVDPKGYVPIPYSIGQPFVKQRRSRRPNKLKKKYAAFIVVILLICLTFAIYFITKNLQKRAQSPDTEDPLVPPDTVQVLPPSSSILHVFQKGAVCTDGPPCSAIGKDILERNGSAVDATIAAMFCNGLVNMQSMGIGGGFFMTIYIKSEGRAYTINAREMAPGNATEDMFEKNKRSSIRGPLASGVPGEVRGLWAAHQRWGVLPWSELIEPTLDLCRNGFNVSKVLQDTFNMIPYIKNDANLRSMFYDEKRNEFKKISDLVLPNKKLCRTLSKIAEYGGDELYNGSLAKEFADDLKLAGSIITLNDLNLYEAKISDPIAVQLTDGDTLYTVPPPSSGILLGFILNILSGYNFTKDSINGINNTILTYHRIIEAFKFAFAKRTYMGDIDFVNITELLADLTSQEYASEIRSNINDKRGINDYSYYGGNFFTKPDNGTAHVSILAPNGDAVSATSTINFYFGAGWTTRQTGIIMNNGMDDFSSKFINAFGLPGSPANKIEPYKKSLSSMSPSILVDKNGNVRMVIGASGGTKIVSAVSLIIIRSLWFDQSIKEAVDAPRFHHQLYPMEISYEYGILQDVLQGLKALGHKLNRYRDRGSIICALKTNETGIYANADYRKGGDVFGIN